MRITKGYYFEASHMLPHHDGKCRNLHGHSYRLEVTVSGPLQDVGSSAGMVSDFADVSAVVKPMIVERLDHSHLNDTVDNPTCERLILWMWSELAPVLEGLDRLKLWETANAYATVTRRDFAT